jgi:hypothetical protein
MPRLDKVEVWIETTEGRKRYEEHKVSVQGNKMAECFIESKAGAGFTIACEVDRDFKYHGKHDMWILHILVDGRVVDYTSLDKGCDAIVIKGAMLDSTSVIPFEFGERQFSGDL